MTSDDFLFEILAIKRSRTRDFNQKCMDAAEQILKDEDTLMYAAAILIECINDDVREVLH